MRKLNVTDGRTDRWTDRQTDGRTVGVAISPVPGPTAPAGDNNLSNQSTQLKFENSTRITSEKLHDAIHLGSSSILLINI